MSDALQLSSVKPTHAIYLLGFTIFMLGFFLFPSDAVLHKVFIVAILVLFPCIVWEIWRDTSILRHPLFYCMIIYMLYNGITGFWTDPAQVTMGWDRPFVRSLYVIAFCLGVAWVSLMAPAFLQRLLTGLMVAATFVALLSILFWWIRFDGDFTERLYGITRAGHAIQGAASFAVIFLLALVRLMSAKSFLGKLFYTFVAATCLSLVLLAQTRGVLIGMGVACIVLFIVKRDFKPLLLLGLVALLTFALSFSWLDWSQLWDGLTRSMPFRMEIWTNVLSQAVERPVFGHGVLYEPNVQVGEHVFSHAHSIYVSTFFYGGLVGLALYGLMILCALYYAYINRAQEKYLFAFIVIIFASIALSSDVGKVIASPNDLWFYFWFPIGIILSTPLLIKHQS